ncbi:hypothetical protein COW36_20435 [bacterium (Candidatus Blackallbacteria) CG17_big_fil_post_rev_8_21_14_2_50_48_46]|uniref:Lipoprotein n=1 Tax=bacterium (Candidatus Blackallbacteria) CG17_big_fil_post_rev_8_21_14_2_50_48_46 TaxID=2014261 RepID=A0A2M7FZF1_9BACT|nr:MAG: hypothetical protein COW64_22760 [bacterium (Candidatus Blackallbacteria) CG18_big_fil_WC_8_21_14_2_50_49_26]PIW14773.1 MAG: hypothetical protein COW36_20435 [bacterium (Candidatus Blackallbacteria) CG17_big_fil_post_rev_8_21_14_2_50_48_46]PIW50875.1 MAG: hypothetical protein COW20_01250 [bacterium (Candidatus Blackallbacteria) CG13_big_fil_rev_8_21_14_2_50_49_14]
MPKFSFKLLLPILATALLLPSCQQAPLLNSSMQMTQLQRFSLPRSPRAASDLVEAPGFKAGDNLNVKGPLWYSGSGKVHTLTPDAFKIEFSIASYHLIVSAERINATQAKFVTVDVKQNRTVEAIGTYSRVGSTTIFDMGKGSEVEKLTVKNQRNGYFETDVVQPGKLSLLSENGDPKGNVNLKFTRK